MKNRSIFLFSVVILMLIISLPSCASAQNFKTYGANIFLNGELRRSIDSTEFMKDLYFALEKKGFDVQLLSGNGIIQIFGEKCNMTFWMDMYLGQDEYYFDVTVNQMWDESGILNNRIFLRNVNQLLRILNR